MKSFQITFGSRATIIQVEEKKDAETWANNYMEGEQHDIIEIEISKKTDEEKLVDRRLFGEKMRDKYLLENDIFASTRGVPFSEFENNQQIEKFSSIIMMLSTGNLRQALLKIQETETDEIYNQTRKDADILAITEFIESIT